MKLLITCFPWDIGTGGGFIIRHWVRQLDSEPIHWFALSRPSGQVPFETAHATLEFRTFSAPGNVRLGLGDFWRWYHRRIWSGRMAAVIQRRLRSLQPRLVWIMADFGIAPIALRLIPALGGRRVHISIHDDLEATAQREGCSRRFFGEIRSFLDHVGRASFTADAVSEELLARTAPAASRSAIVTLPVLQEYSSTALHAPAKMGPLTIGYSGNFLGQEEFNSFVEGLRMWAARSAREWRLRAFGAPALSKLDSNIEAHSFTEPREVRRQLRECDFLLLPCPLDRPESQTNLPTRLITYLEAGRLVFAFAPRTSATERIMNEGLLGTVMHDRNVPGIASRIDELLNWDLAAAGQARSRLIAGRFSAERIQRDLLEVMA